MASIKTINAKAADNKQRKRIAAYCRVSTDSSDQLNSLAAQVDHYTTYIRDNPEWELVDIYADEGLTGLKTDKRDEFLRLMRDCRSGLIDRILVKSVSRFSRNIIDCLSAVRELKLLGITVYFEKEGIDSAHMTGEMSLAVSSTMAQEESISISNNLRWSWQRRMRSGDFPFVTAPYGYRLCDGELVIHEVEAEVIRSIFTMYLSGIGKQKIAQILNSQQASDRAKRWYPSNIIYILRNECYMGDSLLQKKYTTDTLPYERKRNYGEYSQYYVDRTHPPIVTAEVFEKAQQLTSARTVGSRKPVRSPLSMNIRCCCGRFYRRSVINGKVYWECRRHSNMTDSCSSRRLPEVRIYAAFVDLINKLRCHKDQIILPTIAQLDAMMAIVNDTQRKVYELDVKIAEINQQNHVLTRLKAKGYIDSADFASQAESIGAELNRLRRERRRLLARNDDHTVDELSLLYDTLSKQTEPLIGFDATMFENTVEIINVMPDGSLAFRMLGGIELTMEV